VTVVVLQHGVSAAQGLQRGQRPDARPLVVEVVGGAVERVTERAASTPDQVVDLVTSLLDQPARVGEGRARPEGIERRLLARDQLGDGGSQSVAGGGDAGTQSTPRGMRPSALA